MGEGASGECLMYGARVGLKVGFIVLHVTLGDDVGVSGENKGDLLGFVPTGKKDFELSTG